MVCERKNRLFMFSVDRKISTLGIHPFQWKKSASLVSHWNGRPSGWDFPIPNDHMMDSYPTREIYEPRHDKTCLRGLRPGRTQTGLLSYRDKLGS